MIDSAATAAGFACFIVIATAGWGAIVMLPIFILVGAVQIGLRWFSKRFPKRGVTTTIMLVSDLLLIGAALLRYDAGDGTSWFAFSNRHYSHSDPPPKFLNIDFERYGMLYDLALLAPVAISWIALVAAWIVYARVDRARATAKWI